jgi:hypothetical protein
MRTASASTSLALRRANANTFHGSLTSSHQRPGSASDRRRLADAPTAQLDEVETVLEHAMRRPLEDGARRWRDPPDEEKKLADTYIAADPEGNGSPPTHACMT